MALTAKGRNQNYKITKLIIIVVLIVIIIIIIMITIIIIFYHYQFLNQLKQMTFCCCRSFLSVCLLIFSLSKLEGLKQILPARCQRLVLVPWTTEVPCDKKAVRTLYPPDWIPHLSSFPEKKKQTNTYDNLAVHLFRHFRRKTFTFTQFVACENIRFSRETSPAAKSEEKRMFSQATQFVAEGKLWISNGLFIEINTFFCIFSITFTALLNAFSVCNVRTWEKR